MWDLIVSVPDHCLSFYIGDCDTKVLGGLNLFQYLILKSVVEKYLLVRDSDAEIPSLNDIWLH